MLAQVVEELFPGEPYTSSDGTWETVVFKNLPKPGDEAYEYTLYTLQNAEASKKFREERNTLLDQSDRYMLDDFPQNDEGKKQLWADYRQLLRDLPTTARPTLGEDGTLQDLKKDEDGKITEELEDFVWPTPPQ